MYRPSDPVSFRDRTLAGWGRLKESEGRVWRICYFSNGRCKQCMQCKRSPATRSVDATVTVFTWGLWNQNVHVCGMTMYMQCLCIHAMYTVHCTNVLVTWLLMTSSQWSQHVCNCNNINRKAKSGPVLPFVWDKLESWDRITVLIDIISLFQI